ncbi:MAG TPA: alanyl-tRNA editing protein [Rectinemataceae bacterium]|nr:alanyl-tRNA editing protein [Rectinemataceae bacterium]
MPETVKEFYLHPSAVSGEAKVLEIRDSGSSKDIILDHTIFYPEGGGQPCDLGRLGGMALSRVEEDGLAILHRVEGEPAFAVGDTVTMEIDAARRRDHSQQHSGQHLLSAILEREYGVHTVGFHLGGAYSTIDVSCASLDAAMIDTIEAMAERFIVDDRTYARHFCPPEDAQSFPIRKKLPAGEARITIVEIEGYDWVACCGTHVASASELRVFKILATEKYKGATRIYFAAGDRAIALLGKYFGLLKDIAGLLGTSAEESSAKLSSVLLRSGTLESERNDLVRERAGAEIDAAIKALGPQTSPTEGPEGRRILRFSYGDRDTDAVMETVKAGAARGFAVIALSLPDKTVCIMKPAETRTQPIGLGIVLKSILQELGGRGGGGANNFRATFGSAKIAERFAEKAASLLN